MFNLGTRYRKIDVSSSELNDETILGVIKEARKFGVFKLVIALILVLVGCFLASIDIYYPDASIGFEASGGDYSKIFFQTQGVIPGVICLVFAAIIIITSGINVTIKK